MNLQVTAPDGTVIWLLSVLPCAVHDLAAAGMHGDGWTGSK